MKKDVSRSIASTLTNETICLDLLTPRRRFKRAEQVTELAQGRLRGRVATRNPAAAVLT